MVTFYSGIYEKTDFEKKKIGKAIRFLLVSNGNW